MDYVICDVLFNHPKADRPQEWDDETSEQFVAFCERGDHAVYRFAHVPGDSSLNAHGRFSLEQAQYLQASGIVPTHYYDNDLMMEVPAYIFLPANDHRIVGE